MNETIVIAGAGLCGLAAARSLPRGTYRIGDAASVPGGLCRSFHQDGYTFDCTGHLLHLKGPVLEKIQRLLGEPLVVHQRRARIRTHGVELPFPFQGHLAGLPSSVRDECLEEFERAARGEPDRSDFAAWSNSVFGRGITRHFMRPYNEKLLCSRMEDLATDWVGYIPRPRVEEVRAGARGEEQAGLGYNAEFRYPRQGGIGVLPAALADGVPVEVSSPLLEVIAADRMARLGTTWNRYSRLLSTVPLPQLIAAIVDAPVDVSDAARDLEAVGVLCLNLGISAPTSDAHWIYFPESNTPFFRVGFYHNICPTSAPPGHSALYVELSYRRREDLGSDYRDRALAALVEVGILSDRSRVETCHEVWIDSAYTLHTERRSAALNVILPYLERIGIIPAGRYGRWAYTSMGEAIEEGEAAATRAEVLRRSTLCPAGKET